PSADHCPAIPHRHRRQRRQIRALQNHHPLRRHRSQSQVVRVEAPLENGASLHLLLHFCFLVALLLSCCRFCFLVAAFAFLAVALAFLVVIPEGDLLFTTL